MWRIIRFELMSRQKFDDECPGCLPILIDAKTMKPMAEDSPQMKIVYEVWAGTTKDEREAFHQVTCLNSRDPALLVLFMGAMKRIENALKAAEKPVDDPSRKA